MGENTIEDNLHILRVEIDRVIKLAQQTADRNGRDAGGREISLTITKLQEAKMWAGAALGERGEKLPEQYRDEAKE